MNRHDHLYDKLSIILSMTIFGTIGIVRRFIPYPSSVIAMVRGYVGAFFLFLVHIIKKESFSAEGIKKNGILLFLSGSLIGFNWILLFESYRYTTVSAATMAYYMAPVIVILVSPVIFHEHITLKKWICSGTAVFGMVLVSGVLQSGLTGMRGILLGLGAAAMYASVVILNRFIKDISTDERTLFQLLFAAVAVTPYVCTTEDLFSLETTLFLMVMLAAAGIIHTGIAYALYFGSMNAVPAQTVALFSYIDPVVAVILSVLVLKETMSLTAVLGVILVLGSMLISEL